MGRSLRILVRGLILVLVAGVGLVGGAFLAVVAVDLTVGFVDTVPVDTVPAGTPNTVPGDSTAAVDGGPRFDERHCPEGASLRRRCGFLDVPESRSDPDGRRVRVAVSIREGAPSGAADDGVRRAVVMLAGGPGGPLLPDAWVFEDSPVLRDVDVIVLDQRGSGRSIPSLVCAELDDVPPADDLEALRRCLIDHLLAGIDVSAYTTSESAADIEDLRRVLGYDQFDLIGMSYGTRLALDVARAYPDGVRSIVLLGTYPRGQPWVPRGVGLADVLHELDTVCASQAGCSDAYGPLEELLVRAWRRVEDESGLDRVDEFEGMLFDAAYGMEGVLGLPRVLAAVESGEVTDPTELERLLTDLAVPTGTGALRASPADLQAQFSVGLFQSAMCSDNAEEKVDDALIAGVGARLEAAGATAEFLERLHGFEGLAPGVFEGLAPEGVGCDLWGVPPLPAEQRAPVSSDIPTLVLSGRFDPVTPPRSGAFAARTLGRAQLVVAPHLSHGLFPMEPCVDGIVGAFLGAPEAPVATACLADVEVGPIVLP